ncbi:MAG: hypothetical protein DRI57_23530 [Deltaproteobacteria bacterium]|nr:MAG: hypothetical protein DRI57_23530 [Deltaproteobacteria bacterium]
MNPYDFVPIDFSRKPERHPPISHEKFQGLSGKLEAKIIAETPVFIKTGNSQEFVKNKAGDHIIPGTSLKGLFRSVVETVASGCFGGKFDGRYRDHQRGMADHSRKIPFSHKVCTDTEYLCTACRTFGMLHSGNVFAGKVSFEDAICHNAVPHDPIYTVELMGPKPHHTAFYLDAGGKRIAGRKFYFHHPQGVTTMNRQTRYNQRIHPLNTGSEFTFTVSFTNLENDECQTLLYAILLEPDMRHKIGYAKPSGLGSVRIEITRIQLIDYAVRYTSSNRGITEYEGESLRDYTATQIQSFTSNSTSQTLNELRRIWRWDVNDTTQYRYPTAVDPDWFSKNPAVPVCQTP